MVSENGTAVLRRRRVSCIIPLFFLVASSCGPAESDSGAGGTSAGGALTGGASAGGSTSGGALSSGGSTT
jgi:hypothetical protein